MPPQRHDKRPHAHRAAGRPNAGNTAVLLGRGDLVEDEPTRWRELSWQPEPRRSRVKSRPWGWGLLVTQINRKVLAACRKHGKLIATLVLNVTGVPLYPPSVDLMALTQLKQPIPQLPIRNRLS